MASKDAKARNPNEELFDNLNRTYFRGRLPSFTVIRAEFSSDGTPGTISSVGKCDLRKRSITLVKDLRGPSLRQVLLHEMCHIETLARGAYDHGKSFRSRLRFLLRRGEDWARYEIEYYKLAEREFYLQKQIKTKIFRKIVDRMDDMTTDYVNDGWLRIRRLLSYEFGVNPGAFSARFPWARDYWRLKVLQQCQDMREQAALLAQISMN